MMPGVRVDSGVETGDAITPYYDPMIAKLIAYGSDRETAIRRMGAALDQYTILGVTTNIAFLRDVIANEAFFAGDTTTAFIDNHLADWTPEPATDAELDIAAIAATLMGQQSPHNHAANRSMTPGIALMTSEWGRADGLRKF